MKQLLSFLLLFTLTASIAQQDSLLKSFENKKNKINHNGMIVLTTWSAATIVGSIAGYGLTNSYEEKQFYIMNGAWGVINLAIAMPGLLAKPKAATSFYQLQKSQTTTEKIFLANTILDVVYITGGLYLKEYAKNQIDIKRSQQFNGFGNAIIIQGFGLFMFDTAMTILNNQNRKKRLHPLIEKATISFTGNFIKIGYNFN